MYPEDRLRFLSADQSHILETFANQTALAIERARLAEETERARIQIETERQRNALLSSISHDLRTPLASITGAVSSLLENEQTLDSSDRHELAQLAYEEAGRLNRQISNLLDMTRLESGAVKLKKEWQSLEEVIGATLNPLTDHLADHPVHVSLPEDMPLVPFDSLLIGQVFVNLLENAAKYTPPGTPIEIAAIVNKKEVTVEVADRGPGLPPGEEEHIFDKFYRASPQTAHGIGLGLTICRSIIEAHGGHVWAENRAGGGSVFRFTLPIDGNPPEVKAEDGEPV
jgi:two-component system sensor histidine kinase KdpD